jgi:hypothetical protein
MAKVGQIVTIPGSCCRVMLDSGKKIIVNHKSSVRGASAGARTTANRLKLMGFSSGIRRSPTSSRVAGSCSRGGDAT